MAALGCFLPPPGDERPLGWSCSHCRHSSSRLTLLFIQPLGRKQSRRTLSTGLSLIIKSAIGYCGAGSEGTSVLQGEALCSRKKQKKYFNGDIAILKFFPLACIYLTIRVAKLQLRRQKQLKNTKILFNKDLKTQPEGRLPIAVNFTWCGKRSLYSHWGEESKMEKKEKEEKT